ncbi:MAG: hypothetical protein IDH49_12370 [Gammaproteobacteria bacterium]|nr:hypothetical protein [Gammaproteobacteria bacterium]
MQFIKMGKRRETRTSEASRTARHTKMTHKKWQIQRYDFGWEMARKILFWPAGKGFL